MSIEFIFTCFGIGYIVLGFIIAISIIFLLIAIYKLLIATCKFIYNKIEDFKNNKMDIKKGTIIVIDGEKFEARDDLNIRFKIKKRKF